jgi:hypothetical protein
MDMLRLLGDLMAQHLTVNPRPEVLIPVPLHYERLRQRGYNQSLELAKRITKSTGIPVDYQACKRIKDTRPSSYPQLYETPVAQVTSKSPMDILSPPLMTAPAEWLPIFPLIPPVFMLHASLMVKDRGTFPDT